MFLDVESVLRRPDSREDDGVRRELLWVDGKNQVGETRVGILSRRRLRGGALNEGMKGKKHTYGVRVPGAPFLRPQEGQAGVIKKEGRRLSGRRRYHRGRGRAV